jgi:hypothetical protein
MSRRDLTSETAQDKYDVEAEARRRGIEPYQVRATQAVPDRLVRDLVADAYRGISQSASMIPPFREPAKPKGTGWVDAAPLTPPSGTEHIDRMVAEQSRRDKLVAIQQEIEARWIESQLEQAKGPRIETEYNPFDREHMSK